MTNIQTSVSKYQTCIDACAKCSQVCNQCFNSCLQEPDARARANCIKTLRLCADVCNIAVEAMTMDHSDAKFICNMCRTICDTCATECTMFKDQHCQQCADVCHQCANECAKMMQKLYNLKKSLTLCRGSFSYLHCNEKGRVVMSFNSIIIIGFSF